MNYPSGSTRAFHGMQDRLATCLDATLAERIADEIWSVSRGDTAKAEEQLARSVREWESESPAQAVEEAPSRKTWNDTVNTPSGRPRRERGKTGAVNPKIAGKYLPEGDFYRMPNMLADDLLTVMPGPILKGYVYAHRLARIDGTFWVSAGTMAVKIGSRSTRHGQRVLARLQETGLLRLLERGSKETGRANVYQLVPLETLDLDRVRAKLQRPLKEGSTVPETV
jgi:hypothetical protein